MITFDGHIHFFKKHTSKLSANCAQQSMILTYQIFCVLNPDHYRGYMTLYFPLISMTFRKFTILTDQIIHTLKNEFAMLLYVIIQ